MEYRNQTLHSLPVLKTGVNVIDNDRRKNIKSKRENNIIYKNVIKNTKKDEPEMEKADVKNPKYMLRREKTSLKNLKETLSACSGYAKRLIRSSHTTIYDRKSAKHKTPSQRTNRIKMLISPNARKLIKKRSNINQDLIKDIYGLNLNSPCYALENTCNISSTNIKNKQNLNYCKVQTKRNRQNNNKDNGYKPNCNKLCKLPSKSSNAAQPTFKLISFPDNDRTDTELEAINMARNDVLDNCQNKCEETPSTEKEVEEPVCKPCCSNAQRGGNDACNIGIQCSAVMEGNKYKKVAKEVVEQEKSKDKSKLSKDNLQFSETLLDPLAISQQVLFLVKTTVKYLVFALVFIVWSPCLVTIYFCWLVTYALRPINTINGPAHSSRSRKQSQIKILVRDGKQVADTSVQTDGKNTWSALSNYFCWTHQPIAASLRAFKELLSSDNDNIQRYQASTKKCSNIKQRILASDPQKKYTLYYNRHKGWVIKCKQPRERKEVPKRTCQQCDKQQNILDMKSQNIQCSCRVNAGQDKIKINKKSCQRTCSRNRHQDLCTHKSGVIRPESLNTLCKCSRPKHGPNVRSRKSKSCPLIPLSTVEQLYRKYSSSRRITKQKPLNLKDKIWRYCKKRKCNIKSLICDVDTDELGDDVCKANYMYTRKRHWNYVHKHCPSFYPVCLEISKFYKNLCHYFLLLIAACIWCPLLACCYMCYKIICNCF